MKLITKYSWIIYLVIIIFMLVNAFFNKNDDLRGVLSIGGFCYCYDCLFNHEKSPHGRNDEKIINDRQS